MYGSVCCLLPKLAALARSSCGVCPPRCCADALCSRRRYGRLPPRRPPQPPCVHGPAAERGHRAQTWPSEDVSRTRRLEGRQPRCSQEACAPGGKSRPRSNMAGMNDVGAYHPSRVVASVRAPGRGWCVAGGMGSRHAWDPRDGRLFPRRKSEEKRPFKIAWPWRRRPKPQPKPLDLIRKRVAAACQRCSDRVRRLHQVG